MPREQRKFWTLALVCLGLAAGAASAAPNAVATLSGGSAGVEFRPAVDYEKLVLTVSGPGELTFRREFAQGEAVVFSAFRKGGQALPDGNYTYELTAVPRFAPDVRQKLAAARKNGNERAVVAELRQAGKLPKGTVQSGSFVMESGSFIVAGAEEETGPRAAKEALRPVVAADQVIPDDLIVQQSLCVGFDCVNNESFGFDTIRLKENNTRIKFEDTSVGTFPTNDWQLTANDSASGGSSKFSIEDITGAKVPFTITAGASTNSIFVDSTGRVGLRTSTPVLDLHINTSNTPAIRLEQNNSGGFTAQTWDIGANEANFFVRDVTGGSRLSFRIRPGAPTSSLDISADGDIGIGTASPAAQLHVLDSTASATAGRIQSDQLTGNSAFEYLDNAGNVDLFFGIQNSSSTTRMNSLNSNPIVILVNSTERMRVNTTGVTVTGDFSVTGTKNFAMIDPADSQRAIYYSALEGPEAGTYYRGSAKTVGGTVVIDLPGYFTRVTEPEKITVQLTPVGAWGQLYVAEKSRSQLVVKVGEGQADLEFDYLVQGIRQGYSNFQVERENDLPN